MNLVHIKVKMHWLAHQRLGNYACQCHAIARLQVLSLVSHEVTCAVWNAILEKMVHANFQDLLRLASAAYHESLEYGKVALDILSDLPFLRNSKRVHRQLLGGWKGLSTGPTITFKTLLISKVSFQSCHNCMAMAAHHIYCVPKLGEVQLPICNPKRAL